MSRLVLQRAVAWILSAISKTVPSLKLPGLVGAAIFSIAVAILAMLFLPAEDIVKTWFPTLESMWSNIP